METYNTIRYKYDMGAYSLKEIIEFVDKNKISKEEFKYITNYHYDQIKKRD